MICPGDTFGIYTVIGDTGKKYKDGHRIYLVECNVCHKRFEYAVNKFAYGYRITKCRHDKSNANLITNKRIKRIYRGMYNRCYNKKSKDYHVYGARGILICDEWLNNPKKFEKWAKKNGYEKHLSIDRIDSDGPYAPWNCRWITVNDNSKFRSITNVFEVDEIVDSGSGWSKRLNHGINFINTMNREYGKEFTTRYIHGTYNGFKVLIPKDPHLFDY